MEELKKVIWELYDKEKTYFDKDGKEFPFEKLVNDYPIAKYETVAIQTAGRMILSYITLENLKQKYDVEETEDEKAIHSVNEKKQEIESESTPIERIASALEYIELYLMKKEGLL